MEATGIESFISTIPGGVFTLGTTGLGTVVLVSRLVVQDVLRREIDEVTAEISALKQKIAAAEPIFNSIAGVIESLQTLNVQVAEIRREMAVRNERR
jgi:hypothetical protein